MKKQKQPTGTVTVYTPNGTRHMHYNEAAEFARELGAVNIH